MPKLLKHVPAAAILFALSVLTGRVMALEADFRLKWFTTGSALPAHDAQRQLLETPAYDSTIDLRSMLRQDMGDVRLIVDHSLILLSGDTMDLGQSPDSVVDQTVTTDTNRWVDLTWEIEDGNRHRTLHRLDRLALQWRSGDWNVTVGREAISWGSGIVFQPLDLFSPFSPTVVDRDYKAGDDLVLIDRLLPGGHDLQLLHVVRRDDDGHVTSEASSSGLKWHGYAGPVEFEAVAGRHYDEQVAGLSLRMAVGETMLRTDVVATRHEPLSGGRHWRVSGIVNADYSFMVGQRNAYVFGEYFYNDWGVEELPFSALNLPQALQQRLQRGEIFNLMRQYLAVGGSFEWHPLLNSTFTVIGNLDDGSMLAQLGLGFNPSDTQAIQAGWVEPLGDAGDEFGGVPLFGQAVTSGGGSRGYLRWVLYF